MPRQKSRMRVVSNTSPVSNLAIVNRLGLLKARYEQIAIPPAVHDELQLFSHPEGRERLAQALREGLDRRGTCSLSRAGGAVFGGAGLRRAGGFGPGAANG